MSVYVCAWVCMCMYCYCYCYYYRVTPSALAGMNGGPKHRRYNKLNTHQNSQGIVLTVNCQLIVIAKINDNN